MLALMMFALTMLAIAATPALAQTVERPAALVADGPPEIPDELAALTRPYLEYRTATVPRLAAERISSMLIATAFGNTSQVHRVARRMALARSSRSKRSRSPVRALHRAAGMSRSSRRMSVAMSSISSTGSTAAVSSC
jgi:hypothetical protein